MPNFSPVTPDVIRWALDEDGRSRADLAQAVKVDIDTLDGWADGDSAPTTGEVTKLAAALSRPRSLFFLPRPPTQAGLPASFRQARGSGTGDVSADARKEVRKARRVQHAIAWARREREPVDMPQLSLDGEVEAAAITMRAWLQVDDTSTWPDDMTALRSRRAVLDAAGVLVFELQIGRDDVRGFSAWDDRAPLIVVNSSGASPTVRSFTLAHELGHLALRADSACMEPAGGAPLSAGIERWCEAFGAAFLMPSAGVRALMASRTTVTGTADIDDVRALMTRYKVSGRSAAIRLRELGYAGPALYAEIAATFRPATSSAASTPMSPPRPIARIRQYGPTVIRELMAELPERDSLAILRITVDDARALADEVPGVPRF